MVRKSRTPAIHVGLSVAEDVNANQGFDTIIFTNILYNYVFAK